MSTFALERVTVPDLQQVIKQQIKRYIIENGLRVGDRLPTEEELARQLGASRAAIREALSGLEALGIIEVRHGSGRYVREFNFSAILDNLAYSMLFDVHTFEELLDIRQALEVSFLPRAIETITPESMAILRTLIIRMEEQGAGGEWDESMMDTDIAFHRTIYANVGNDLLLKLLDIFWTVHKNLRSRLPYRTENVPRYVQHHRLLFDAIERRDVALAQERLVIHFQGVREWITKEKEVQGPTSPEPR
jgi:DNA-binding FadR family transcriptional regulator